MSDHTDNDIGIRRECRVRFADPDYAPPTTTEIRQALRLGGLDGASTAKLLGVTGRRGAGSRTVRKWTGGESQIPYSAWRLLLVELGLAL